MHRKREHLISGKTSPVCRSGSQSINFQGQKQKEMLLGMFLLKFQQKADAVEEGGIQGQVPWPEMQVLAARVGPVTGAVCSGLCLS